MTLRIQAGRLIDGSGGPPVAPGAVLIDGNRIVAVGEASDVPNGDADIVFPDGTLLPGLVDAHTHASFNYGEVGPLEGTPIQRAIRATRYLQEDLFSGVTLVRVVGEMDFIDVDLKLAVENGTLVGPRMVVATRGVASTNGHCGEWPGFAADGPDEVRKAVRTNLRRGADLIKLFVTGSVDHFGGHFSCGFTRNELEAAVEEAHRVGKPVCAHAVRPQDVALCVETGIDAIEHGHMLDATTIELMVSHGTWLVATLALVLDEDIHAPLRRTNPTFVNVEWLPRKQAAPEAYRAAIQAGVRWVCGTDAMHGRMVDEIAALVGIGIDPMQTIVAATRSGAELCGMGCQLGTLQPGKLADLIVVDGDPLKNIQALRTTRLVVKDGRVVRHITKVTEEGSAKHE